MVVVGVTRTSAPQNTLVFCHKTHRQNGLKRTVGTLLMIQLQSQLRRNPQGLGGCSTELIPCCKSAEEAQ